MCANAGRDTKTDHAASKQKKNSTKKIQIRQTKIATICGMKLKKENTGAKPIYQIHGIVKLG